MGRPKGNISINVNDIIGKRLGKLKVICYVGYHRNMTEGGERVRHIYECKCDCGRIARAQRGQLLNEIVHSCGCSKHNGRRRSCDTNKKQ